MHLIELYKSVQGESSFAGLPCIFIRLTACNLRCSYCDTAYAFTGGQSMEIENIMQQVANYGARYVTVTGGEPLAQKECLVHQRLPRFGRLAGHLRQHLQRGGL